jgi:VanZ family protein
MSSGEVLPAGRPVSTGALAAVNSVYAGLLVVLAYLPHVPRVAGVQIPDTAAHVVAYGIQGLLLLLLLRPLLSPGLAALGGWLGAVAIGALTELVQVLQPTRSPELRDVVADAAGAVVAVGLAVIGRRWRHRPGL